MPFEKGRKKTGGRKKGATNKTTRSLKEKINDLVEDLYLDVLKDIKNLDEKERLQIFIKLLPYVIPKAERPEASSLSGDNEITINLVEFSKPITEEASFDEYMKGVD